MALISLDEIAFCCSLSRWAADDGRPLLEARKLSTDLDSVCRVTLLALSPSSSVIRSALWAGMTTPSA